MTTTRAATTAAMKVVMAAMEAMEADTVATVVTVAMNTGTQDTSMVTKGIMPDITMNGDTTMKENMQVMGDTTWEAMEVIHVDSYCDPLLISSLL